MLAAWALECRNVDLYAAVSLASGWVVRAVSVGVVSYRLGFAVTVGFQVGADAVGFELSGDGGGALFTQVLVEGVVTDGVGVTIDLCGGHLSLVKHGGELGQSGFGFRTQVVFTKVEQHPILQGDYRAAALDGLEAFNLGEFTYLGYRGQLFGFNALPVY